MVSAPPCHGGLCGFDSRLARAREGNILADPLEVLRREALACIAEAGISQAEVARRLDVTPKHISQMLTGKAQLTWPWAQRIAWVCDMEMVVVRVCRGAAGKPPVA